MILVRVALDVPLDALFDYRARDAGLAAGQLVVVPFGKRRAVAVVIETIDRSDIADTRLRWVERVVPVPPLAQQTLDLVRFCSDYYHHPFGQALLSVLPASLRRPTFAGSTPSWEYTLTPSGANHLPDDCAGRAIARRRLFEALRLHGVISAKDARALCGDAPALLERWTASGWVEKRAPAARQAESPVMAPGPELTDEQRNAVERVTACFERYSPWLLDGVTGSGKTEVYFRLIEQALFRGKQTLLLVPEINLTPQLEAGLRARFPGLELASLHSGLASSERLDRWQSAREGKSQVILGTRLSVFTPMPRLGLVIVDEEHDASFKQQDGMRYSARDLAVFLAQQHGVPVVLGSATPALETYQNAVSGRFGRVRLDHRPAASPPEVVLIDTRQLREPHGLSVPLLEALGQRLARGEQSLVFLNRRGFAPTLVCSACGWAAGCSRCAARLVWHLRESRLRCHYCGHEERLPKACPACGNQDLRGLGQGTQKLEQVLEALFPSARILRIDRDSTRRKQAWPTMRSDIHADRVDILVGTQMLAKGHDFPMLTLVAIVNPDGALFSADFRAGEKLFQQLMQVAGRAGRAGIPGQVLVQTRFPDHPLYQALARQDYRSYAENLLEERRASGFPPFVYQAVLRAEAADERSVMAFLENAARLGQALDFDVSLYDPVPATIARVAGHFRAHLLVQAESRGALRRFLASWHPLLDPRRASRVRWALDVDPIEL
jgi:primosomal protein N' (replication factor Y) (superfamily II helicase)